jgi:type II secretory pathway component PulJ
LGKKTMENELLKEAVEYGRQKVDSVRALVAGGWQNRLVSRSYRISRWRIAWSWSKGWHGIVTQAQ